METAFDWTRKCDLVGMARVIGLATDPDAALAAQWQRTERSTADLLAAQGAARWGAEIDAA